MKRFIAFAFVLVCSVVVNAQVVDAPVCEILKTPASFNNKIVRVKGTVSAGFDHFVIQGKDCGQKVDAIWLAFPEGTKAKSGPAAVLVLQPAKNFAGIVAEPPSRTAVTLDKNKDFKQFDSLLSAPLKTSGMCLGCVRNQVTATIVGRIDAAEPTLRRDASGKIVAIAGFGNLNAYSARLVLQSVSDVAAQEIDASKPAGLPAPAPESEASSRVSRTFASTIAPPDHPKRAIKAFGEPNDDNGVDIGFGGANEASARFEAKSDHASPDGVVWECLMDGERLKGDAMGRAMAHMGEHIADLRNPEPTIASPSLYQLEYRAWMTTMLSAALTGQKSLQIPGGYLIWSAAWPSTSLNSNTDAALSTFFANQAALSQ